jgi:hypothetical protein
MEDALKCSPIASQPPGVRVSNPLTILEFGSAMKRRRGSWPDPPLNQKSVRIEKLTFALTLIMFP